MTTVEPNDAITLRIYRAPSGQWSGKLFAGGEEIGGIGRLRGRGCRAEGL
jgi:hypothetical protein